MKIFVTSPLMPKLEDFYEYQKIFGQKRITNNGYYHCELEVTKPISGSSAYKFIYQWHLPLVTALQAMDIKGGYYHSYSLWQQPILWWNKIKPVFVDIDPTI